MGLFFFLSPFHSFKLCQSNTNNSKWPTKLASQRIHSERIVWKKIEFLSKHGVRITKKKQDRQAKQFENGSKSSSIWMFDHLLCVCVLSLLSHQQKDIRRERERERHHDVEHWNENWKLFTVVAQTEKIIIIIRSILCFFFDCVCMSRRIRDMQICQHQQQQRKINRYITNYRQ